MFNECCFCGNSYGYEAIDEGHLHKVGRRLVCYICLAELRDALGFDIVKEAEEDPEIESHTTNIFDKFTP